MNPWNASPSLAAPAVLCLIAGLIACDPGEGGAPDETSGTDGADGAAPVESRTLDAPPDLQVGEWWTVEVRADVLDTTFETTMVVTERREDGAVIGIPPSEFSHAFLIVHIPPLGDVDLSTLSWRVMWDDFEALRFPLEEGRTWAADFHGNDVEAEVTEVDGSTARVTMLGERERIDLTYDAAAGMITDFREEALRLGFRVTDHGFGYSGPVKSLRGIELGFMETAPAWDPDASAPARGTSSVEVDSGASHATIGLIFWNAGFEDEPGSYRITATAPDGTIFDESFSPSPGGPPVHVAAFGTEAVDGTWEIEFERDGPARLLAELFPYDLTEVRPDGAGVAGAGGEER